MRIQRSIQVGAIAALIFLIGACVKRKDAGAPHALPQHEPLPSVSTLPVSSVGDTMAVGSGDVTYGGTTPIRRVGVTWDTVSGINEMKNGSYRDATFGVFTAKLSNLKVNKTYYVRAIAVNDAGSVYGEARTFTTGDAWKKITSPALDGFSITCMEVKGNSVYLGTTNGVLFSPDAGDTWQGIGLKGKSIASISLLGDNAFAGCSPHVYRTSDNGANWTTSSSVPGVSNQYTFTKLAARDNKLFLIATFYVYVSTDNGDTWNLLSNQPPRGQGYFTGIVANGSDVVVANDQSHVYISKDDGASWTESNSTAMINKTSKGFVPIGSKLYLRQNNAQGYISSDFGNTWQPATTMPSFPMAVYANGATVFVSCYVDPSPRFLFSVDGGSTWATISTVGMYSGVGSLVAVTDNYFLSTSFDGVLYRRKKT